MPYTFKEEILKSRRGDYQLVELTANPLIWTPMPLDKGNKRHRDVMDEVKCALNNELHTHKYWQNEPQSFIEDYQDLYFKLFDLSGWIHDKDDRHNIVVCANCCLTLVQYHSGKLIAYSRSTDMRNGYFSDKLLLEYLAEYINAMRPKFKVEQIIWYMALPHVYLEKGVARLLDNKEVTE